MAGSTHGGLARDDRKRSRSRSQDYDSDAERRRRRHRRERSERGEHGDRRSRRTDEGRKERRDGDEMDVERRRSRSPRSPRESSRRHHRDREHRDAKHRSRRERSPRAREEDREMQVTRKAKGPLPSQEASFSVMRSAGAEGAVVVAEKQLPNYAPTGLLAAATKTVEMADGTSVVLKYHEPSEARKPAAKEAWKLFVFKGGEIVDTIELGLRSCWLIGREVAVVDLAAEHPSVSKQHAVIQFRYVERRNEFGDKIGRVRPYLIDLESANGTVLNGERVEERRYVELRDRDLIRFGDSTREYVVMLPPKD